MLTIAQRRVYDALTIYPLTPAEIKRRLPGKVPVSVIRQLLGELGDLVTTGTSDRHPGTTAYQRR